LSDEFIYATPFNSYTHKFGFEKDSDSPATNLTACHWYKQTQVLLPSLVFFVSGSQ